MGQTLHFISHTHWDREWYMSFEQHRIRLVELMDKIFETFDKDPDFKSFHMDGQIIVLEDYLEIKPYMLEKVKKYVQDGRLVIGPWYVLQDEYLISGEANVRNLLYGIRQGRKYGPMCMVGYFPDAFGNISQAPQILRGFGIDNAVFGRGVYPIGFDNTVIEKLSSDNIKSEVIWQSPDGSEVLGIVFANWYHNAYEVPENKEKAAAYIKEVKRRAEAMAATPHLLLMNGCDHQPVQTNLAKILKDIQDEFPQDTLVHSNFNDYLDAVREYKSSLQIIEGELTGQRTNGYCNLINTASSRMYLKKMNHVAQNLLEKWVEPVGVMSWSLGDTYREEFIWKAWQYLLQNHPHDSICGCSVDDVHEEMVVRYKKSMAIANEVLNREKIYMTSQIDTSSFKEGDIPLVVFNTQPWNATENITASIDLDEDDSVTEDGFSMYDCCGEEIPASFRELGRTFTYTLPDDSFRKVRYVKRFEVEFCASDVPGLGHKTFVVTKKPAALKNRFIIGSEQAENDYIKLEINKDGSLRVTNKETGVTFDRLNMYEDSGDIGEEYNYTSTRDNKIVTTENNCADISLYKTGNASVTFRIGHKMQLPVGADKQKGIRKGEIREFIITSYVTLGVNSRRVDIKVVFDNNITDHRLRALFPTQLNSDYCYADGQFDIVKRPVYPWEGWTNPSNCHRQQAFVDMCDGYEGLVVANRGLPEYEVLRDGTNSIALTLVRSVGELGDWGHFPTPGAQCQGLQEVEYSIIPYGTETGRNDAYKAAYQFSAAPLSAVQETIHEGTLKMEDSFIKICGRNLVMSALKKCEDRDTAILRLYNIGEQEELLQVDLKGSFSRVFETNMNEDRQRELEVKAGRIEMPVGVKKIITLELERYK